MTVAVLDGLQVLELEETIVPRLEVRLLAHAAGRAADVERPHGELGAGFADGLGADHAHRLAHLHHAPCRQIAAVAAHTDSPA